MTSLAALLLARIVVGEAGFSATPDDVAAHHAVLADVSARRGWSYVHAARIYSPRHTGVRPAQRRPWVAELSSTMRTPPSFPRRLWPVYRGRWERLLESARQAVAGELAHRCDGEPSHWGGPAVDHERIERGIARGYWRRLDCGETANVFLEVVR